MVYKVMSVKHMAQETAILEWMDGKTALKGINDMAFDGKPK